MNNNISLKKIVEALQPFAQSEFCKEYGGNVEGDESIVFERNHKFLRLGDFRRAAKILEKIKANT